MTTSSIDALIVIDMQNSFCHPQGAMYDALGAPLHDIERVVEANAAVVSAARSASVPVVFIRHQFQPGYADYGPLFPQFLDLIASRKGLLAGSWDAEILDGLDYRPDDLLITKSRLDAFHNTALDILLRSMGASRLALTGIITNACVETTARAAAMRDYAVTILADCTASGQQRHQEMSLECLATYNVAEVRWSKDLAFV